MQGWQYGKARADLFEANISADKLKLVFLGARATLKENTITTPKIGIEIYIRGWW